MCINPFKKSEKKDERLKLFLFGESGAGKTFLSLQFPSPAVIDLERGTSAYNNFFDFQVLNAGSIEEVEQALRFLLKEKHEFKTLIIDPLSILWEMMQDKWSDLFFRYNKRSKGFKSEYYEFQSKDWMTIKKEWKRLIRKILSLDMNIICTARQKDKYSFGGGDFMTKIGETFDVEKNTEYYFDTSIQLVANGKRRVAYIKKDRGQRLGENSTIENPTMELFRQAYPNLAREAEPVESPYISSQQIRDIYELAKAAGCKSKEDSLKTVCNILERELQAVGAVEKKDFERVIDGLNQLISSDAEMEEFIEENKG